MEEQVDGPHEDLPGLHTPASGSPVLAYPALLMNKGTATEEARSILAAPQLSSNPQGINRSLVSCACGSGVARDAPWLKHAPAVCF